MIDKNKFFMKGCKVIWYVCCVLAIPVVIIRVTVYASKTLADIIIEWGS